MRYLINYYAAIFLPLISLYLINLNGLLNSEESAILLLAYALVYHPIVSGVRLVTLGAIKKSEFFLNFIPSWNIKHFGLLFFNIKENA
jgi:hypothetical protein